MEAGATPFTNLNPFSWMGFWWGVNKLGSVALDFVTRTGVDALAVAIGTAHGTYPKGMLQILQKNPETDYMHLCMAAEAKIKQFVKDYMKVISSS